MAAAAPRPAAAIEAGINIDVHQDIPMLPPPSFPNGFRVTGRLESGAPGTNWSRPPVLTDHVDGPFPVFSINITPDLSDPGQNWYFMTANWSLLPGQPGIPYCIVVHLGLLFDLTCHNVVIDGVGMWTFNGAIIGVGHNQGFWPVLGFQVDNSIPPQEPGGQFIRIQGGNANGIPEPGEIEGQIVQMDLFVAESRAQLVSLLGPEPFRELRLGGMQEMLPWTPVMAGAMPISPSNPVWVIDSFFDVALQGPGFYRPPQPMPIPPGGFLIARERIAFIANDSLWEERWHWELHEAHEADLGDAPDSSNSWLMPMTAYPPGGPPGIVANYPTVYMMGSPPHGPIHWQPSALAFLGPMVTTEFEADIGPDQDPKNNLTPLQDLPDQDGADDGVFVPMALPHCQPTVMSFNVTIVQPPPVALFVNVWFDWNRDGDWDDLMTCPSAGPAPEWAVQNMLLPNLPPGMHPLITTTFLPWHPPMGEPPPIWMRITLAEQPWQPSALPGYGGRGPVQGYEYGETEDYYFLPNIAPPPEACCLPGGGCVDVDPPTCVAQGGQPMGPGSTCGGISPAFLDQPDPAQVCAGDAVTFAVQTCGLGPLNYQWYKSAVPPIPVGTNSPIFTINLALVSDSGDYYVTVTDGIGSTNTSNSARLDVWVRGTGDANLNNVLNGLDIQPFVSIILSGPPSAQARCACDMNGDGMVTTTDVSFFVSALLSS